MIKKEIRLQGVCAFVPENRPTTINEMYLSGLYYLKNIPITTLKIDKSFVDDVPESVKDASILQSIVQLGQSLNIHVVVEGVETEDQVNFLNEKCNSPQIQGYYFAKPMKMDELENWCYVFTMKMNV